MSLVEIGEGVGKVDGMGCGQQCPGNKGNGAQGWRTMALWQSRGTQRPLALLIPGGGLLVHMDEKLVSLGFLDMDSLPLCRSEATSISEGGMAGEHKHLGHVHTHTHTPSIWDTHTLGRHRACWMSMYETAG